MRALLDTHAFLWWIADAPGLSDRAREVLADDRNELLFSVASAWEIAIKVSLGKLEIPEVEVPEDLEQFVTNQVSENAFEVLPVSLKHALGVYSLPQHHKDPFDRLLIAQALAEGIPLLSRDPAFSSYPIKVVW